MPKPLDTDLAAWSDDPGDPDHPPFQGVADAEIPGQPKTAVLRRFEAAMLMNTSKQVIEVMKLPVQRFEQLRPSFQFPENYVNRPVFPRSALS